MKLYSGKRIKHEDFGDGVIVSPRVKGGWATARFGGGSISCKVCPSKLREVVE